MRKSNSEWQYQPRDLPRLSVCSSCRTCKVGNVFGEIGLDRAEVKLTLANLT